LPAPVWTLNPLTERVARSVPLVHHRPDGQCRALGSPGKLRRCLL